MDLTEDNLWGDESGGLLRELSGGLDPISDQVTVSMDAVPTGFGALTEDSFASISDFGTPFLDFRTAPTGTVSAFGAPAAAGARRDSFSGSLSSASVGVGMSGFAASSSSSAAPSSAFGALPSGPAAAMALDFTAPPSIGFIPPVVRQTQSGGGGGVASVIGGVSAPTLFPGVSPGGAFLGSGVGAGGGGGGGGIGGGDFLPIPPTITTMPATFTGTPVSGGAPSSGFAALAFTGPLDRTRGAPQSPPMAPMGSSSTAAAAVARLLPPMAALGPSSASAAGGFAGSSSSVLSPFAPSPAHSPAAAARAAPSLRSATAATLPPAAAAAAPTRRAAAAAAAAKIENSGGGNAKSSGGGGGDGDSDENFSSDDDDDESEEEGGVFAPSNPRSKTASKRGRGGRGRSTAPYRTASSDDVAGLAAAAGGSGPLKRNGSSRGKLGAAAEGGGGGGGGGGDSAMAKKKNRMMRKAELARASRLRKKAYVTQLEEKLNAITAQIAALELRRSQSDTNLSSSSAAGAASAFGGGGGGGSQRLSAAAAAAGALRRSGSSNGPLSPLPSMPLAVKPERAGNTRSGLGGRPRLYSSSTPDVAALARLAATTDIGDLDGSLDFSRDGGGGGSTGALRGLAGGAGAGAGGAGAGAGAGGGSGALSPSSSMSSLRSEDDDAGSTADRFADTAGAVFAANACLQQLEASLYPGVEGKLALWLAEHTSDMSSAAAAEAFLIKELQLTQEQVSALRRQREALRGLPAQMEEAHRLVKELRSDVYTHFSSLTGLLEGVKGSMRNEQLERFCAWVGKNKAVASGATGGLNESKQN